MHGICFDYDLQDWFDFKIPKTKVPSNFIQNCLKKEPQFTTKPNARVIWLDGTPQTETFTKSKKGNSWEMIKLTFHHKTQTFDITLNAEEGKWLVAILDKISVFSDNKTTFTQLKADFETNFEDFELFWYSKPVQTLRQFGLLIF
jgi:hypothetical protein